MKTNPAQCGKLFGIMGIEMTSDKEKLPKIKEMTKNPEVVKYDEDISKLINDYNFQIKEAKNNAELSELAFFEIGKKLIKVESKITEDNKNEKKAKKVFAAFKLRVADQISKNISNVDKVFKVALFCETDTYKKYQNRLPDGWGTLYLLLSLKDDKKELDIEKINELMSDSAIVKDIKRADLIKKIDAIKNPNKIIKKEVVITIEGGEEPTQEELKLLQQWLKKKLKKWNITKPEIKSEQPASEVDTTDKEEHDTSESNSYE